MLDHNVNIHSRQLLLSAGFRLPFGSCRYQLDFGSQVGNCFYRLDWAGFRLLSACCCWSAASFIGWISARLRWLVGSCCCRLDFAPLCWWSAAAVSGWSAYAALCPSSNVVRPSPYSDIISPMSYVLRPTPCVIIWISAPLRWLVGHAAAHEHNNAKAWWISAPLLWLARRRPRTLQRESMIPVQGQMLPNWTQVRFTHNNIQLDKNKLEQSALYHCLCIHLRLQQSHILLWHWGWTCAAAVWLKVCSSLKCHHEADTSNSPTHPGFPAVCV